MQMTSRGEGGCVTGRSPVYFFHSESTPSSPLLSLSVTAGVGNVKGRTKTSLLSSLGLWPHRTPPHLPPLTPKKSRANQTGPAGMKPEAEHTPIDSTILQHPPKTLKCVIVPSRISCKTKTVSAFGFPLFSWPQYAWHFSRRVLCTLASANIRKLFRTQTLFSLLPARGHANAHGPRGKFF